MPENQPVPGIQGISQRGAVSREAAAKQAAAQKLLQYSVAQEAATGVALPAGAADPGVLRLPVRRFGRHRGCSWGAQARSGGADGVFPGRSGGAVSQCAPSDAIERGF